MEELVYIGGCIVLAILFVAFVRTVAGGFGLSRRQGGED